MSNFQFRFTSHNGKFSYNILPIGRLNGALNVLTRTFYTCENLCRAIGVSKNLKAVNELNELVKETIKDGISIVVVDNARNEIIGVSINKIQKQPSSGEMSFLERFLKEKCKEKESASLIQLMIDCDSSVDVFKYFKVQKLMEIIFLGVLPEYGKQGIGLELMNVNLKLLAELSTSFKGPNVATALWTSNYSAKIGENLGFRVLFECFYASLQCNGIKLLEKIDDEHESIKMAVKKLQV